jgi:hypothetical protein
MFGHTADYTKCALTTRYIDSYIYEWVYTNVDEACNRQGLGPIEITLSVDDPLLVDDPQPKEILLVDFINTTTSAIVSYINSSKGSNDYLKYINIDDETIKELYSQCEMLGDLDTYRMSIESYIGMLGIVVSYYTFGSIKYPY